MAFRALLVASLLGVRALGALFQGLDESILNKTYDVIVVGGGYSICVFVFAPKPVCHTYMYGYFD